MQQCLFLKILYLVKIYFTYFILKLKIFIDDYLINKDSKYCLNVIFRNTLIMILYLQQIISSSFPACLFAKSSIVKFDK